MIAVIDSGKIENVHDLTLLATIGAILKKEKHKVTTHKNLDFAAMGKDETLYFIQHGSPGDVAGVGAVTVDDSPGMSHYIGQAIKKAGVDKCPPKIVLKVCNSGLDFWGGNQKPKAALKKGAGYASLVRGVAMALAKYQAEKTTVTGYLGPAVISIEENDKLYVAIPEKVGDGTPAGIALADLMKGKSAVEEEIQALLKEADIAKRAVAIWKAEPVRAFNRKFVAILKANGALFADGKGVVKETFADGLKHL